MLIYNENLDYKLFLEIRSCLFEYKNNEEHPDYKFLTSKKLNNLMFEKITNSFYFNKKEKNRNKYSLLNRFENKTKLICNGSNMNRSGNSSKNTSKDIINEKNDQQQSYTDNSLFKTGLEPVITQRSIFHSILNSKNPENPKNQNQKQPECYRKIDSSVFKSEKNLKANFDFGDTNTIKTIDNIYGSVDRGRGGALTVYSQDEEKDKFFSDVKTLESIFL